MGASCMYRHFLPSYSQRNVLYAIEAIFYGITLKCAKKGRREGG